MKIRRADRWDINTICDMLRNYRTATPWKRLSEANDQEWITRLLTSILAGAGVIFLAEKDDNTVGMIIGIKNTNIWDPKLFVMNELAFWVEPEHRGSTAGYKLIKTYIDHCKELKNKNIIEGFTLSKMINSPDLDYGRFGFEKLEEMWRA